ncbi:sodium:solute symporter family transporter [Candidatus Cardinium hertigii]|uniref:sodium:solute symporter family transporter n=1 Tax=Candidatus Cardinium hertigii TaxID=247481 RepID=UPI003D7E97FE
MIYLNMPIAIVGAFLGLTLVVGIYFSRKETSLQGHAVGNKEFSTASLVATVLATGFGAGGLIRNVQEYYNQGLYWMLKVIGGVSLGYCVTAWLALRMGPFMRHLSLADSIGRIYGKLPRFVVSISTICYCIVTITAQLVAISKGISICIGSDNAEIITVFSALILIFYSSFGGIRAVTYTDVMQFTTFAIIIPLLAWFMFVKSGKSIVEMIPIWQSQSKFQFKNLFHLDAKLINILFILLGSLTISNPTTIQRIYMASNSIQASKVFFYSGIFRIIITIFIILVSLFVFIDAPELPVANIWNYIMNSIPPMFKGCLGISMIAMAMSTADSYLNICSVTISHDIVEVIRGVKKATSSYQLRLLRISSVIVGLLSMLLAFSCRDLLALLKLALNVRTPITDAPLILAIFGFRGTARTALIGMFTGTLSILAWNKWIAPTTDIHGAFPCMLANGLAMLAAHYLLKQPESAGWVGPDHRFKQMEQENARKRADRKEAIRNGWKNKKLSLTNLKPSHATIAYIGFYFFITGLLYYFTTGITNHFYWFVFHLIGSACCLGYPFFYAISKKVRALPNWFISLFWLIALSVYIPLNVLWNWSHLVEPYFNLSLSLAHLAVSLWVLPLYIGITAISVTLLLSIYPIYSGFPHPVLCSLLPLLLAGLFLFTIIICLKINIKNLIRQNIYLKDQKKISESQKIKASLYEAAMIPSTHAAPSKRYGSILAQVVRKVEESISFLDKDTPLYKEDFQTIIHKFYDWIAYFNKREKAKDHTLLQTTKITLAKLIRQVEVNLSQEIDHPPKLLVEDIRPPNNGLSTSIVCDIHQVTYALVKIISRMGKLTETIPPIVKVTLHPTALQFKQADGIGNSGPVYIDFQAIALIISLATADAHHLPKVKACYHEIDGIGPKGVQEASPSIDLEQDTLSSVVRAHYGYLETSFDQKQSAMLMILPIDVSDILHNMTARLPIDSLTTEAPITPKEQADSMMKLMQFHDHVCKASCETDPIDVKIISGILLLLRKHFGFKRHISGQLFYVRIVGIAQLVVDWAFHSPKVVYAALLYGLVRRTCLPLSYIKEHYNLGVYAFVSNVIKIDKREELDHPSLLYVQNRLAQAIKEEHLQLSVLFIKLAERLYDLRHAAGYIHLSEVKHIAQETLNIDVQIANTYLDPAIGQALEEAAKEALELCIPIEKDQHS